MTTNRTSRRAEEFDRALTAGDSSRDPAVAKLVALAGALAAVPQRPAPMFRDALRARLVAEAASVLPAAAAPVAAPAAGAGGAGRALRDVLSKPAMQVATGSLAAAVAVAGAGVGASRSLPGDPLYGLKKTVEGWQVGLAGDGLAEANALLEHARTRLDEIKALLDAGRLGDVEGTVSALRSELQRATERLLAIAPGSREVYDRIQTIVQEFTADLVALYPQLPPAARPALSETMQSINGTSARLSAIPVPAPTPEPTKSATPTSVPTTPSPSVVVTTPSVVVTTPSVVVTTPSVVITTPPPTSILPTSIVPSLPIP